MAEAIAPSSPSLAHPWHRFFSTRTVLIVFVGVTSIAILGQTIWAIVQDRRLTLASEQDSGLIAVRSLEEHAQQQLAAASNRLNTVAVGIRGLPENRPVDDNAIHAVMEETLANNRSAGALQFVNTHGDRWASTLDFPSFVFSAEQRDYIDWLLKLPDHRLFVVGSPLQRIIDGELVLPLAQNVYARDGRHLGLISTEVSVSYFKAVYGRVAKDSNAVVQLLSNSGLVVVNSAATKANSGPVSTPPIFFRELQSTSPEGFFESYSDASQTERYLYTYRKVEGFPITTLFGRELGAVLSNWTARTWDRIFFSGVFIAFHLLLTGYLLQHMRRLEQSEARLRSSESRFVDLFQRAPVPLAMIQVNTDELIEVNETLMVQFGYQRSEFLGKTPLQLGLWNDPTLRVAYIDLLKSQGFADQFEAVLRHKNGSPLICLLSTRLIDSEGKRLAIFSPIDVSRQREIEAEIRVLNTQLEQRVLERTTKLQSALDSLTALQTGARQGSCRLIQAANC